MAGCGLPRPTAKSLQSGRGHLPRHREPQLVFAILWECSHPLEPVPRFGDVSAPLRPPPARESAFSLCYWLASLPQPPGREGKTGGWDRSEMRSLGSLWRNSRTNLSSPEVVVAWTWGGGGDAGLMKGFLGKKSSMPHPIEEAASRTLRESLPSHPKYSIKRTADSQTLPSQNAQARSIIYPGIFISVLKIQ